MFVNMRMVNNVHLRVHDVAHLCWEAHVEAVSAQHLKGLLFLSFLLVQLNFAE